MGRRAGRRDRRAQERGTVEALVRAGWSEAEVQHVLDLARADGLDPGEVAVRLLVAELRQALCGRDDLEAERDDEECGPGCELCAAWGPRDDDGWTRWC